MRLLAAVAVFALLAAGSSAAAEPIHFSKLIELLPGADALEGFERQKPEGTTTAAMGFHTTVVSAVYEGTDDDAKTIKIQYTDGAPTQFVTMAYGALAQFSQESTEGYEKGVKLGDFQAIEKFRNEPQDGTLTVVVDQILVQIDTSKLPAETLRTVWEKIPAKELLAAKKSE